MLAESNDGRVGDTHQTKGHLDAWRVRLIRLEWLVLVFGLLSRGDQPQEVPRSMYALTMDQYERRRKRALPHLKSGIVPCAESTERICTVPDGEHVCEDRRLELQGAGNSYATLLVE